MSTNNNNSNISNNNNNFSNYNYKPQNLNQSQNQPQTLIINNPILLPSKNPKYNNEIYQTLYNSDDYYFAKDKVIDYSVRNLEHVRQVLADNNFTIVKKLKEGGYGKILLIKYNLNNLPSIAKIVRILY